MQPSTRHSVAQVLDKTLHDNDICESTVGNLAGSGLGIALNPMSAFVADAATSVILLIGSKNTMKWRFLKDHFLKFLSKELFSNHIIERSESSVGFYEASVSISAFDIQNEMISDLLRPSAAGLKVSFTATDGVIVEGLQKVSRCLCLLGLMILRSFNERHFIFVLFSESCVISVQHLFELFILIMNFRCRKQSWMMNLSAEQCSRHAKIELLGYYPQGAQSIPVQQFGRWELIRGHYTLLEVNSCCTAHSPLIPHLFYISRLSYGKAKRGPCLPILYAHSVAGAAW